MKSIILAVFAFFLVISVVVALDEEVDEYNIFTEFEHLTAKFGHGAVDFLKCMGPTFMKHCKSQTLHCMTAHNVEGCLELINCEGKDAKDCISHIKKH